jgi:hypothetical protein
MSFDEFIRSFSAYVRRFADCNFVMNNPRKPLPVVRGGETKEEFKIKKNQYLVNLKRYEDGIASLYSHLYFSVANSNPRATNIIIKAKNEGNGIKAMKGLSKEYKDDALNKSGLNLLRAEFQNRNI